MADRLPPLVWLRSFEAAARHLSFSQAARELALTQPAVSRHIRLLEARLGQPLFYRLPQSLQLTEAGRSYLPAIQDGFHRITAGTSEIFGGLAAEPLTIRTTPGFAEFWLAPRLNDFLAQYPDIDVRISSTVWQAEAVEGDVDLEIRYGEGHWPGASAQRLTDDDVFPVCQPELASFLRSEPVRLAEQRLFHTVGFQVGWPDWLAAAGLGEAGEKARQSHFDTAVLPLNLAAQGAGVALGRTSLAATYLADGRLAAPFDLTLRSDEAFYLAWPEEIAVRPAARAFATWLETVVA